MLRSSIIRMLLRRHRECPFELSIKRVSLLLESEVTGNNSKCGSTGPIYPEIELASTIGIRWLAGGSCIDIRHAYRFSIASIYRCQDLFLDSVLKCADLKIVFAETRSDLIKLSTAFEEKNKAGLLAQRVCQCH